MQAQFIEEIQMEKSSVNYNFLAWTVTLIASLFFFYEFIQMNMLNAITADLMRDFQLDAASLGKLSSMYFWANMLFLFPAGMLLDRFSTKKLLLVAVTLCTVGTFAFGLAHSFYVAAAGRFLVGLGASFCFLSCIRIASRWFPPTKMAYVTGIVVTIAMLGGLVAQTPFAVLTHLIGWRNAVLVDGALGIVIALAIRFMVQDRPPGSHEKIMADKAILSNLGFWRCFFLVLSNKNNWLAGLYTTLLNLPIFIFGLWGINYLEHVHHLSNIQASYANSLLFFGVILGSPAFGFFSDKIGRRILPMIIGAILSLITVLCLMYIPNQSLTSLNILFFLIGFVTSSQVLSYPTIAELNPIALTSTAISIDSVLIMLSGALVQPFFGWLMELGGDKTIVNGVPVYSAHDFFIAMLIMPIAFVIGLIISFFIKETYCKSQA